MNRVIVRMKKMAESKNISELLNNVPEDKKNQAIELVLKDAKTFADQELTEEGITYEDDESNYKEYRRPEADNMWDKFCDYNAGDDEAVNNLAVSILGLTSEEASNMTDQDRDNIYNKILEWSEKAVCDFFDKAIDEFDFESSVQYYNEQRREKERTKKMREYYKKYKK